MALQLFYAIGIVATVILLLQIVLSLIGLGGDHDLADGGTVDVDASHLDVGHLDVGHLDTGHAEVAGHENGPGLISLRSLLAFFSGFGWGGALLVRLGLPPLLAAGGALIIGGFFLLVVFWLMGLVYTLSESGTIDLRNAVGQTGTVYLPIPPQRAGKGQVQVVVQGRLRELPAMTDATERLATGTPVRVVALLTQEVVLVEKL